MNARASVRPWLAHLGCVTCLLGSAGAAAAQAPGCLRAALSAQPGFAGVALVRQGEAVHLAAQGSADEAGTPLNVQARLNVGSVGKMFTAVAVAQLLSQGKLALDAPVGRWVDGLAPSVAAVTLRQLLTHSAGLGNYFVPENLPALQQAKTLDQQLALSRDEQPAFEPGSRFGYSNNGFLLLGRAVENASGMPFEVYLQRHVFAPAGMTQTSFDPSRPSPAATGFTRLPPWRPGAGPGPGGPMEPPGPLRPAAESALPGSPAGGAYSTAEDMARFIDALEAGRLVAEPWLSELTRRQIDATPPGARGRMAYGLGFALSPWEDQPGFGHNGGLPGAHAEVMHFPQDRLLIVVLANRDPPVAGQLLARLRQAARQGPLCT